MCSNRIELIRATCVADNNLNHRLSSLYDANWDICRKLMADFQTQGYELANPYLLAASDNYPSAAHKVMCLGKETQGWGGEFTNEPTIKELQQLYTLYIYHEQGNGAAFHNFVGWLSSLSPNVAVIPNNIVKIGKRSTNGYYKLVANRLHEQMNLLREEIAILAPTLIVCPTSNLDAYNAPLHQLLGDYEERVLQQELFVSERRYEAFADIPFIMLPHPQGKTREDMDSVKRIVAKYILG